jgi:hypothetical protein
MSWPDGAGGALRLQGHCRDLLTPALGDPKELGQAQLVAFTGTDREIASISAAPTTPSLERLVGCRAGGNLRAAISRELPDEVRRGSPLHLLLDDLAGATLIAGFAYVRWADRLPEIRERVKEAPRRYMRDICSGFRDGASTLLDDGTMAGHSQHVAVVSSLSDPGDAIGWHDLGEHPPMAMRRARRIDVWPDDGSLRIDAMFRDSCWDPDGTEVAVHEYHIAAMSDRATGELLSITADPRVLPYLECPLAAPNASRLVGTDLRNFRREVLQQLRGPDCCTHLNDALRSLAEVPVLANSLPTT